MRARTVGARGWTGGWGRAVKDFSGCWKDFGLLTAMKITLAALWTLNIWKSLGSSSLLICTLYFY